MFNTYETLKTEVLEWTRRAGLTGNVETFVGLCEARANRNLRVPEMEKRSTSTPTDEYVQFPADFLALRSIQVNANPVKPLKYVPPHEIDLLGAQTGSPVYYTVAGNALQIFPSASGSVVEIAYYAEIPPLTATNSTNWLLDGHADYYLAGSLLQAYIFTRNPLADQYAGMVAGMEQDINRRGKNKRFGDGPIYIRTAVTVI